MINMLLKYNRMSSNNDTTERTRKVLRTQIRLCYQHEYTDGTYSYHPIYDVHYSVKFNGEKQLEEDNDNMSKSLFTNITNKSSDWKVGPSEDE